MGRRRRSRPRALFDAMLIDVLAVVIALAAFALLLALAEGLDRVGNKL